MANQQEPVASPVETEVTQVIIEPSHMVSGGPPGQSGSSALTIDITDLVVAIDVNESIDLRIMTADMLITDGVGVLANLPLVGQEKITFTIHKGAIDSAHKEWTKDLTFFVRSIENISKENDFTLSYQLKLVEEAYFLNSLNLISEEDLIFSWYKNKKKSSIIKKQENETAALNFLEKKFDGLKTNNIKILYDMGGIYKSFEKYDEAIKIYSKLLDLLDNRSKAYADILYRRGGSFERIGDYETADKDLLESLKITRENPYVLNYLAYSWLERNYKIELSMEMLKEAYDLRKNDPYITDSLGWGYYLINDFENAEKYLKKAVELMPYDPIVNDHYGDILSVSYTHLTLTTKA